MHSANEDAGCRRAAFICPPSRYWLSEMWPHLSAALQHTHYNLTTVIMSARPSVLQRHLLDAIFSTVAGRSLAVSIQPAMLPRWRGWNEIMKQRIF